jgi:Fe-S-cluster containining protein
MTPATSWGIHCAGILPYGCKMYRFPVTYGQTYTFKTGCGDGATANFNTFLELFNSSCSIIALNDDGCENLRSSISWVADYTGYVYLKVSGVGASSGSYNLSYRYEVTCSSCVSCPNYDYQFTPAASWGLHSSGILPNSCKMYRFWITGGQIYTFKTGCGDGATANFDTYLELYNGNCSLLMNNDDGCESLRSSITWPANFTGYVYLKVRGWGSCSGTYNLAFRNNSVCGSMPVDADMQTIAGNAETVCGLGAGSYGNETNKMISEGQISKKEDGQKLTGLNVYPNPGNGRFSIVIDNGLTEKCQIVIYNAFGQIILKENDFTLDEHSSVDISDELNGIYYVHIRMGAELFRQKLIIQR